MGTYLNPDNQNFANFVATGRYVDKTMLADVTNSYLGDPTFKYICISRPRRFGKSIAENMLVAYYSKGADSRQLFSQYKLSNTENFSKYLNKFNVIHIDLNSVYTKWQIKSDSEKTKFVVNLLNQLVCKEFYDEFSDIDFTGDTTLAECILKVYSQKKETFIIIIDEYDVLVRERVPEEELDIYRAFLNSLFKSNELNPAISLAYLTGILPIMKDKIQSKLNTFNPYTMLYAGNFAEFVGFTNEEVKFLCEKNNCDYELCKSWYDGYKLEDFEVYNPESVIKTVTTRRFKSYWSGTSTYLVVDEKIKMNFSGIKEDVIAMLGGEKISADVEKYDNTMTGFRSKDDVYSFLIHLGYLAYDEKEECCYIPNREIHLEWQKVVSDNSDYAETDKIIKDSKELLAQTLAGNEKAVSKALDRSHIHVTSNRSYNNEYSLQSAIYLAYIYALNDYTIVKELTSGKGFADIAYIPFDSSKSAIIVELKHNKSAETALNQIKEKQYFQSLKNWHGDILFVGINYDDATKTHDCKIERFVKE